MFWKTLYCKQSTMIITICRNVYTPNWHVEYSKTTNREYMPKRHHPQLACFAGPTLRSASSSGTSLADHE